MITTKEGLVIINHLLGTRPTKLQELVFRQSWRGQSYKQIAREANLNIGHVKNVGSELWQLLSRALDAPVNKNNFRSVLDQYWLKSQESQSESTIEALLSEPLSSEPSRPALPPQSSPNPDLLHKPQAPIQTSPEQGVPQQDWDEAIDVSVFVDRDTELDTLTQWVQHDRCRLVLLLGMGGIGKTALAVKLAQQLVKTVPTPSPLEGNKRSGSKQAPPAPTLSPRMFEFVIWRSLREAPPIEPLLSDLLKVLSNRAIAALPAAGADQITQLVHYLSVSPCLLVLDNIESLLQGGEGVGQFRKGYEAYAELFRRIAQSAHQSCVLLTSRETPKDINQMQGQTRPVRVLQLKGLEVSGGQAIFAEYGSFDGSASEWQTVINHYAGNPLALKITASRIQDGLDGNLGRFIREYLRKGLVAFADIHDLLDCQFDRLSHAERDVMYWLTVNREAVTDGDLREDIVATDSKQKLLDSLTSLKQRSLIEKTINGFTQQPVVMEYVTNRLIQRVVQEIVEWNIGETEPIQGQSVERSQDQVNPLNPQIISHPGHQPLRQIEGMSVAAVPSPATPYFPPLPPLPTPLIQRYALLKAQCKDYIREVQTRLILAPIVDQLLNHFGSKTLLGERLRLILDSLRKHAPLQPGYTAGNILNLLCCLQVDLTGYDLSDLCVWQAHLAAVTLSHVNFAHADLSKSVFAESFGGILSVAFSPDGRQLAIVDSNGGLRLWDLQSGRSRMTQRVHDVWTWSIAFSPDGQTLATASDDRTAKLWNVETGQCLRTLAGHTHSVLAAVFSPDGKWLATSSDDQTIRLWNISGSGDHDRSWTAHDHRVWSLGFNAEGKILASSSEDHTIKLWDMESGACLQTLRGHANWVKGIAFHPNGVLFASGSHDHTIKLWDLRSGQCLKTLIGHSDAVTAVAFSTEGQQIVSSSHDHTLRVWEVQSGRCLKVLQGHSNRLWSFALHPDGRRIVSGGDDHAAKIWDLRSGQCVKTFSGYTNAILCMAYSADHSILASGHEDETVKLWDLQVKRVFRTLKGHGDRVWSVAFNPRPDAQSILASGSGDQTIKLWNWQTGECLKTLHGHSSWVWSVVFHPSGELLASSSYDGTIKLWEMPSGKCWRTLEGHKASVVGTIFNTSGEWLVSCGYDNAIRIWQVRSGECLNVLEGHTERVWRLAFSPDEQQLVSCSYDHTLKLWDVQTGKCLRTFTGHQAPVSSVLFDATGQRLISGSFDQSLKLWDVQTGECLRTLDGHQGIILSLLLDGQMDDVLISGSFDETLKFWNLNTGECLETLKTPQLYERMNILGVQGLTDAQKMTLQALGAIEISIAPASLVSVSEYRQNGQRLGNLPLKYSVKSQ